MYLKNIKRTATVIYVTFGCMMLFSLLLGIFLALPFFIALFFWWLLLALLLASRWASRVLCERRRRGGWGIVALMGSPFYYVWFFASFISCLNAYAPLVLDLPLLFLSFLAFAHAVPVWRNLKNPSWQFWGVHIAAYLAVRLLSWILRITVLAEFYSA